MRFSRRVHHFRLDRAADAAIRAGGSIPITDQHLDECSPAEFDALLHGRKPKGWWWRRWLRHRHRP